ncbi:MAG: hypothetical protein COA58_16790 [Bacteroidetes bacterium]|nr:MAG: hypothetical protein COA58_16790 [Bacteroidota bacterium]
MLLSEFVIFDLRVASSCLPISLVGPSKLWLENEQLLVDIHGKTVFGLRNIKIESLKVASSCLLKVILHLFQNFDIPKQLVTLALNGSPTQERATYTLL